MESGWSNSIANRKHPTMETGLLDGFPVENNGAIVKVCSSYSDPGVSVCRGPMYVL